MYNQTLKFCKNRQIITGKRIFTIVAVNRWWHSARYIRIRDRMREGGSVHTRTYIHTSIHTAFAARAAAISFYKSRRRGERSQRRYQRRPAIYTDANGITRLLCAGLRGHIAIAVA